MAPNPLQKTFTSSPPEISSSKHLIAGLLTTVHGLEELSSDRRYVSCLWLLHPRLGNQDMMAPLAKSIISAWNKKLAKSGSKDSPGLITVSLDQRNHGSRMVDPIANGDWRSGDEQHAQDMFSAFHGTQLDTSDLITYLSAYVFPHNEHILVDHMALGISLGGHCAWQCALHDPRITTVVVVIGCPDYINLMKQRARLSKRDSWWKTSSPGAEFLGSVDFPHGLVEAVKTYDPAGMFIGTNRNSTEHYLDPTPEQQRTLISLMERTLKGKRILNMAGGDDKLVPYAQGNAFLSWFKRAIGPDGWFEQGDIHFEDHIYDGVGHAMSRDMVNDATAFIIHSLNEWETKKPAFKKPRRMSRI